MLAPMRRTACRLFRKGVPQGLNNSFAHCARDLKLNTAEKDIPQEA